MSMRRRLRQDAHAQNFCQPHNLTAVIHLKLLSIPTCMCQKPLRKRTTRRMLTAFSVAKKHVEEHNLGLLQQVQTSVLVHLCILYSNERRLMQTCRRGANPLWKQPSGAWDGGISIWNKIAWVGMILETLEGSVSAVSTPILQWNTNLLFTTFFEIFFKYTKSTHLCTLIHEKRRSRLNIA